MSQSSFPSAPSSTTFPRFSDETSRRFVPGCRATVDGLLVFFGGCLALMHLPFSSRLYDEIVAGEVVVDAYTAFLIINFVLGLLGLVIAYFTARSSHWRDRQRVLVCLSLALLLYAGMCSVVLWGQGHPQALRYLLLFISATAGATLTCIGLILVEQRLRSSNRGRKWTERVASKRQCFGRIFYGCLFGVLTICCLTVPFTYVLGICDGSLADRFEAVYGCQVSGLNFFCLIVLSLFLSVIHLMLVIVSWSYLQNFHRPIVPSFKEKVPPVYQPTVTAISVCVGGTFIHIFSFLLFHPGPGAASWILLATIICAWSGYKRSAAKTAIELKQNALA